ncbi:MULTISPECIES: class I SAM-dependent methyltransferase [Streptomyces]|uniref:Class I SAM-dependent methyltransferase n=1 Tax=Streptomyces silvisoli TaxID=3034235 RepID=A0ABT5ZPR8_9ACTN|nr:MULTISPECIES: class I SAM-dependent methyltransferase [Streptomyces]MDF3291825.1 class I SAM-dependent methyltransferase [Streptomyces silvisoli]
MSALTRAPREAVHHPVFARFYVRWAAVAEERLELARHRRELLAGLSGRVIEIGAGSGANFRHYPAAVCEVVATEPERLLRRAAADAASRVEVPVDVVPAAAEALPVKSEAFDAAVACLVLCSVRDQRRALAELRRVVRPGGELRLLEHVRSTGRGMAAAQWAVDHTFWPLLFGGCHTGRDTLAQVTAAGFELGTVRRLKVPDGPIPFPSTPHVLCVARRA